MHDSYNEHPSIINSERNSADGRKRKRGQEFNEPFDARPIRISGTAGNTAESQSLLQPIQVVLRAQIPLSILRPDSVIAGRLLSSITCLEETERDLEAGGPCVLLAKDSNDHLHVLERVAAKEYAICPLADHVTLEDINPKGIIIHHHRSSAPGEPWWSIAAINGTPLQPRPISRKAPGLDMRIPTLSDTVNSGSAGKSTSIPIELVSDSSTSLLAPPSALLPRDEPEVSAVDAVETCAAFINNYLDMLYKSKASVAYFAKAHVPRLRVALSSQGEDGASQITQFLIGMVLSSSTFDKKHKSLWPEKVKDILPTNVLQLPDSQDKKDWTNKKNRKRKAKLKPDKTGCLPSEEDYFSYWWQHEEDTPASNETIDVRLKRRSLGLRTREAFLQVILLLELASLQPAQSDSQSHTVGSESRIVKPAKEKDHNTALELLVDKLCIWHSIDNGLLSDAAQDDHETQQKKAPDQLRNFCIEVIVPFYMSKVPEVAANINRKLGGPVAPSPAKRRKTTNQASEGAKQTNKAKRAPLQRVSSINRSTTRASVPSLGRSATDSQIIPNLKREASDISLDSIPLNAQKSGPSRSSTLDKMRLRQREVDFDAMSQAQETRRRKQAEVENKLKEAISALKKPNRVLAGRELADVAEQRELMAQAREKAAKARARKQVQVVSTPTKDRYRSDLVVATPQQKVEGRQPPSSSTTSRIPSSSFGRRMEVDDGVLDTGHRERKRDVKATPLGIGGFTVPAVPESVMRQPVFTALDRAGAMGNALPETPLKRNSTAQGDCSGMAEEDVPVTPARVQRSLDGAAGQTTIGEVMETPQRGDSRTADVDIYSALGWD
ncbi:hypothetical protein CAC42_5031 [Sphaceloma murrayae]|uniref:DNA replication regulator Sld3 C-terminal domain-containing protein n=1 Tax=Sphaceloma murrayae TaxID=2082308 RepID=A0A2K1R0Z7_9PEZI|nr:hypothetical protein CAC42_5031 [Sphaceloma murrayae]